MAVNKAGYVFATVFIGGFDCGATVSIYAPVTGPLFEASMTQPIHTITITSYPFINDLLTDSAGRLFIAPSGPESTSTMIRLRSGSPQTPNSSPRVASIAFMLQSP